jgi:1,4-dihydroxy-2-naphthoate octaprenyltransferase
MKLSLFPKVARANFLPASIIPFFTGAALAFSEGAHISPIKLALGLIGIASAHIAGNMFNDYFDNKSGIDRHVKLRSPFFGGSGAIQEGLIKNGEMMKLAIGSVFISLVCVSAIFVLTGDRIFLAMGALAGILTVGYTAPPLRLAYRRLGELNIFLLFGVFMVMAGFYLFKGNFTVDSFVAALPISFLVAAIILCNEMPDLDTDTESGKHNLVSFFGKERGYLLYTAVVLISYLAILLNIRQGIISPLAAVLAVLYPLGLWAANLIRDGRENPGNFVKASALTIALHALVGSGMIVSILAG